MITTAQSQIAAQAEFRSPSGMWAGFTSSGTLRRFEVDGLSILLYPASELEPGPANIYLRVMGAPLDALGLLGPQSRGRIQWTPEGPVVTGQWHELEFRAAFRLAEAATAWFWHVEVTNRGSVATDVDLLYAQDVALAPYEAVRTNEYYVSQYLDLTPVQTETAGTAVAVRQNMPGVRVPWVLVGCLREAVAWGTDLVQLRPDRCSSDPPLALLADRLPSTRLQHEHTLVLLQERSSRIEPGGRLRSGFFGIYERHHPAATSASDALHAAEALRQPEALGADVARAASPAPVVPSLFAPTALLQCRDLGDDEIRELVGGSWHHVEGDGRSRLSLFTDDGTHMVLRAKERTVLRPHGHILRTGDRLVPDEGSLTSTAWMAGVFHSQVTQGHVALNRLLSTRRGYLDPARGQGLRIFVEEPPGTWALLDEPSAWAVRADSCTWWYRHAKGLIEVRVEAPAPRHELGLRVRVRDGDPCRLLLCAHAALGDDDGQGHDPPQLSADADGVTVQPPAGSAIAARFPDGSFRLSWTDGTVEAVQRDEPLFLDARSRNLPWVTIRTAPTRDFDLLLTARLLPEADRAVKTPTEPVWQDFWSGVGESIRLMLPDGSPLAEDVERLDAILPWFSHDALIHYLAPRGLEQYTGGAWGTRDICQGPASLLLALGQLVPLRDLLSRVFRAQNDRGDWPQWFEFFPRELAPGQREAHGDIIFWPLLALAEYLDAGGDPELLLERLPFVGDDAMSGAEPVLEHVRRALGKIAADTLPGTTLPAYGLGDWNDSLRPAHPELAERLCSTWTVTLQIQALRTLAHALRADSGSRAAAESATLADQAERIAGESAKAMHQLLFREGILAGYGLFRTDGSVEHLVHPSDQRTGLHYGVLHISSAISSDLLSPEDAASHLDVVRQHLTAPDGARLFDRPVRYRGGPMEVFQRAEAATFFGREIGLMYMHAHLRHAEALARYGDARGFIEALSLANPIGASLRNPAARPRQSTCYYTSSDAAFPDRYAASADYDRMLAGEVPFEGGWRVYSSGPGIFLRLIVERLLGLRGRRHVLEVDPVLAPELDGLRARVPIAGVTMDVTFHVGARSTGPRSVSLNGVRLQTQPLTNPYRQPGVSVAMTQLRRHLRADENRLVVDIA